MRYTNMECDSDFATHFGHLMRHVWAYHSTDDTIRRWLNLKWLVSLFVYTNLVLKFKFPRTWFFDVRFLNPVVVLLFSWESWDALVRGNLGDGLPVPGLTGVTETAIPTRYTTKMAVKAFIFDKFFIYVKIFI